MDQANAIWQAILTPAQLAQLVPTDKVEQAPKRHKPGSTNSSTRSSKPEPNKLLEMLARLALRTESSLNSLLEEHQFLIHINPGPGSILPLMLEGTKKWHASDKSTPLRHSLVVLMLETLVQRTEVLAKSSPADSAWKEAEKMFLINGDGHMPYLRWDPTSKMLRPTKDATIQIHAALRAVQNLHRLVQDPTTTLRFHALTKTNSDRSVPWL